MLLLEIDLGSVCSVELECDAPRPIHMNGVARWIKAVQRVETEPRKVHVLRLLRSVETVEADKNPFMHPLIDPAGFSCFEQVRQRAEHDR